MEKLSGLSRALGLNDGRIGVIGLVKIAAIQITALGGKNRAVLNAPKSVRLLLGLGGLGHLVVPPRFELLTKV
jgi:hypothetical protein